jgi:hypothetical protein
MLERQWSSCAFAVACVFIRLCCLLLELYIGAYNCAFCIKSAHTDIVPRGEVFHSRLVEHNGLLVCCLLLGKSGP